MVLEGVARLMARSVPRIASSRGRAGRARNRALLLVLAAALAGCAPAQTLRYDLDQRVAEFDWLLYRAGAACGPQSLSGDCSQGAGAERLRRLFLERSAFASLSGYLSRNGARCSQRDSRTVCSYANAVAGAPAARGAPANAGSADRFSLVVGFPARDEGLAPGDIDIEIRRETPAN